MKISRFRRSAVSRLLLTLAICRAPAVSAQALSERGFFEGTAWLFPQAAPNDRARVIGDLLLRDDLFFKPTNWIQFAAGLDLRANSHNQVDARWRVDVNDRDPLRPAIALRRLSATFSHGPLTIDIGKQFVRWGKTDIVTPTDRFAPRDFLEVFDNDFLAVTGARASLQADTETIEAVWVPRFTPSRMPLLNQRWTVVPPAAAQFSVIDLG